MPTKGFSLLEICIVLTVISLLVSGVLLGGNLLRASELRSVITDLQSYRSAIATFKDKYAAIPGDMPNATVIWGKLAAYCNGAAGTANANGVCNGDGDERINLEGGFAASGQPSEMYMIWKELSLAGLIKGQYTGITGVGSNGWNATSGVNIPESSAKGTGYFVFTAGNTIDPVNFPNLVPYWFTYDYPNSVQYGFSGAYGIGGSLTADEASMIDVKMDDGMPGKGKIIGAPWGGCTNATSTSNYNASYLTTPTPNICSVIFREMF